MTPRATRTLQVLLALAALAFWARVSQATLDLARSHDFAHFYGGARMAASLDFRGFYDPARQTAVQQEAYAGARVLTPVVRPPAYYLALAPLSRLPYETAFRLWLSLQAACALLAAGLLARGAGGWNWVALLWFVPVCLGVLNAQDCGWTLLLMTLAWRLLEKGRDAAAGLVLGVLLFKFNLLLFAPLAILAARRWRLAAGFAGGGAFWALTTLALLGPAGIAEYAAFLQRRDIAELNPALWRMASVHGALASFGVETLAPRVAAAALAAAAGIWLAWRASCGAHWMLALLLPSLLVTPHAYLYDLSVLLPVLLALAAQREGGVRWFAFVLLLPVTYLVALAGRPWTAVPACALALLLIAAAVRSRPVASQ